MEASPQRLRGWFIGGFLLVFIGLAAFMPMVVQFRDGIRRCKLWEFYVVEIPQIFRVQVIGPFQSSLVSVAFQHVALSLIGGLVALAAGWAFRKLHRST